MGDLSKAREKIPIFPPFGDREPLLSSSNQAISYQMALWFGLYTKESKVALFGVFGSKLCLLAYFAYYFTSSGQNRLFLSSTGSILDKMGKYKYLAGNQKLVN